MESGLLNAFHDDQYDDTYVKFDIDNNFWSEENNSTLGLQLSETLHGILPTDDQHIYFSDDIETQYSIELQNDLVQDIYGGIHNEEDIINSCIIDNNNVMSSSPSIEIIPVDPNCNYNSALDYDDENSDFNDNDDDDDDIESNLSEGNQLVRRNSSSRSTFRSRTDSSSIGDYESHSSDESDFTESDNDYNNKLIVDNQQIYNNKYNLNDNIKYIEKNNEIINLDNNYTIIKNDIDIIQKYNDNNLISDNIINTKNFDLAKFITEDDYLSEDLLLSINKTEIHSNELINKNIINDESDIDVDIETVNDCEKINNNLNNVQSNKLNLIENNNKLFMKDNIDKDPSWNPLIKGNNIKVKNCTKNKQQRSMGIRKIQNKFSEAIKRNQAIAKKSSPQKKQFGIGRSGKNITMCIIQKDYSSEEEDDDDEEVISKEEIKDNNINDIKLNDSKSISNLKEIKIETNTLLPNIETEIKSIPISTITNDELTNKNNFEEKPVKRKLNLEEYYKKRRENSLLLNIENSSDSSNSTKIYPITRNNIISTEQSLNTNKNLQNFRNDKLINNIKLIAAQQPTTKSNESLLKNNINLNCIPTQNLNINNIAPDPITEAKNKVLRMQELKKKAAQRRLIDITKVGPITKILPLEEIVNIKKKLYKHNDNEQKLNNELDEIIVVSVSCNTDIKIPPTIKSDNTSLNNNCNLSKSTELLYNISNTIQKVTATDNMIISNNSLISSIQNVVFKKTVVAANENGTLNLSHITNNNNSNHIENNDDKSKITNEEIEHGEDKIIMHLPKNRQRKVTHSIGIQTNILPQFPPLELIYKKSINYDKQNRRKYRSKHTKYSSDDDGDDVEEGDYNYKREYRSRSRSPRQQIYGDSTIYKHGGGVTSTATSSSESSDRDRRCRDRNRRIYSTSPSRSERSRSSSSSSSNSNKSNRSKNRWKKRKSKSRSRSTSRYGYRSENRRQTRQTSPAVEERRIVYVGRIEDETSKEDLKRKFLSYGAIKQITLHYKDTGMKYGFVTFEKAEDAFKAIDNGMRDTKINMYDISFGGRRAFCRATYSDLDGAATNTFQTYSYPLAPQNRNNNQDDSFEALLQKMKDKLCSTKSAIGSGTNSTNVKGTSSTNSCVKI